MTREYTGTCSRSDIACRGRSFMPSPFPGMNPCLEVPGIWPVFHRHMVTVLHEDILSKVSGHYRTQIGERRFAAEPMTRLSGTGVELREEYIEIHKANNGGLVTLVDMVSPANKTTD